MIHRQAGHGIHRDRLRALVVLRWRAGPGSSESLTVTKHDLGPRSERY